MNRPTLAGLAKLESMYWKLYEREPCPANAANPEWVAWWFALEDIAHIQLTGLPADWRSRCNPTMN